MKIIIQLIRLIFFPIKIFYWIIYGIERPKIVGHAWYDREDYSKIVGASDDDLSLLVGSYDKWLEKAEKNIEKLENKGWIVFKVTVKNVELNKWLKKNGLLNTSRNRQIYVEERLSLFLEDPII